MAHQKEPVNAFILFIKKMFIAPAGPCSLVAGHINYTLSDYGTRLCNGSEGFLCKDKKLLKKPRIMKNPRSAEGLHKNMNKKAKNNLLSLPVLQVDLSCFF